jgi:hypothetical protein
MAGACATVLLTGAAFSGFSWRYQLTQIPMISMAGALGVAALLRGAAGEPDPEPVPSLLDRSADLLVRLQVSAAVQARARQAADRGQLQTWVALVLGVMAASLFAAAALASGFVATGTAGMLGVATGLGTSVVLLVARARCATFCRPEQDEDRAGRREGSEQVPR